MISQKSNKEENSVLFATRNKKAEQSNDDLGTPNK
jgi:hypothetical protein